MVSELNVYCNDLLVGKLNLISSKELSFQYSEFWIKDSNAFPISVRLPLKNTIYSDEYTRPFFENLLPESTIRQILSRQFHISENNIFGMLEKIGGDCAGAISLVPSGVSPKNSNARYKEIDESEIEDIVLSLPKHPLLADRNLRLSLAGAQNKLPIYFKENRFYLPEGGAPSSHILKPPTSRFSNTVLNEFVCMKLAQKVGLTIPTVILRKNKIPFYIIERYDRALNEAGDLLRTHQEDFCQASGLLSNQKYQSEGGPSLEQCFALIKSHSIQPAVDIAKLLNWAVFNYLIGNADAHAKNLSFVITKQGAKLSPFYDILCTHIYPELDSRYAMKIGGENRPTWVKKRHWERLSDSIQIKFTFLQSIILDMVEKYRKFIPTIMLEISSFLNEADEKFVSDIFNLTSKRAHELEACFVWS